MLAVLLPVPIMKSMKKYDFNQIELWFSRRVLMWLTCSTRQSFLMHVKKAFVVLDLSKIAREYRDELGLIRNEGGRKVKRKTEIFSLEASCRILHTYCSADFLDYAVVVDRFDELCGQERNAKVNSLVSRLKESGKSIPAYMDIDNMRSSDIELLEILVETKDESVSAHKKRRLIVDLIDGELVQAFEEDIIASSNDVRRVVFKATSGD